MTISIYNGVSAYIRRIASIVILDHSRERIKHFARRMLSLDLKPEEWVIVVLNVDDTYGGPLTAKLMPDADWSDFRERGEIPFARGMASRDGITDVLRLIEPEYAEELEEVDGIAVVTMHEGVTAIYKLEDAIGLT